MKVETILSKLFTDEEMAWLAAAVVGEFLFRYSLDPLTLEYLRVAEQEVERVFLFGSDTNG